MSLKIKFLILLFSQYLLLASDGNELSESTSLFNDAFWASFLGDNAAVGEAKEYFGSLGLNLLDVPKDPYFVAHELNNASKGSDFFLVPGSQTDKE
jgi:hypothetical protein